jgi:hypothetical protein
MTSTAYRLWLLPQPPGIIVELAELLGPARAQHRPSSTHADNVCQAFAETQCRGGIALGILQNMHGSD